MEKNKIHIYLYNALIVLCLLGGAVYVVSQFMHFGGCLLYTSPSPRD